MRVILIFAACLLSWGMWAIAASCIAHRVQFHRADYPLCTTVHNGPIERPDHYDAHPFASRGGVA